MLYAILILSSVFVSDFAFGSPGTFPNGCIDIFVHQSFPSEKRHPRRAFRGDNRTTIEEKN
jgi:hypothetical protein